MATKKKVVKKTAKKSTAKKSAKKKASPPKAKTKQSLPFTKDNTLALADAIYSVKNGEVKMRMLCGGNLTNGVVEGRRLHCAIGEAYFHFVNSDMSDLDENTSLAIERLVKTAQLKNVRNKSKLTSALSRAVSVNDNTTIDYYDQNSKLAAYFRRSEKVSEIFRLEVAPLLK